MNAITFTIQAKAIAVFCAKAIHIYRINDPVRK